MKWKVHLKYRLTGTKNTNRNTNPSGTDPRRELGEPVRKELRKLLGPGRREGLFSVYSSELTNEGLVSLTNVLCKLALPRQNYPNTKGSLNNLSLSIDSL
jgi:hypothetical protein